MKRINLLLLIIFSSSQVYSQNVNLDFPYFAEQEWYWTIFCGGKQDTIVTGRLDQAGKTRLSLPEKYKNYRGLTQWLLTEGGGLTMIFAGGENFSVSCTEAQPSEDNIIYKNTSENTYLNSRHKRQQKIFGKIEAMQMATSAYKDDADLLPVFNTELQKQQRAYELLQSETVSNPLYAARFAQIVDLTRGLPQRLSSDQSENERQMKDFIMNQMDIEVLYTSGHWDNVWDQWLSWYTCDKDNHLPQLISDAKHLLARTQSDEVYAALAGQIVSACEKQNWHDQEIELAFHLLNEDRIRQPSGKIESLYTLLRIRKGAKAPALIQGILPKKKTILAFYDSGCGNCTVQLSKLAEKYPELKKKGYEIVSISADNDKSMFETYATKLPWKDKYCDFEGFAGKDFRNYGIIGTPTFYVLDAENIVQGRYARVEDLNEL
ncbi:MAG: thioredoxin family protein [Prevotella sp.]|jgi:hypothetical protein|nr:thioredoxin family protein [Prevotella sp.]